MELVIIEMDSPEWEYMWNWLAEHPINKDLDNPSLATNNGEVWQYMGSYKLKNKVIHCLRHRYHPLTNRVENLSLNASDSFDVNQIKKSFKIS